MHFNYREQKDTKKELDKGNMYIYAKESLAE
jgi:hypothetical protein